MDEATPHSVVRGFGAAPRGGDIGAAAALLSRQACFVTPDSTVIHGREQIRGFLPQVVDLARNLTIAQRTMLTAGDVAIGSESWRMSIGQGAGAVRTTRAMIVLGRVEGAWRIAVADPWRGEMEST